jgi:hypothetical protein
MNEPPRRTSLAGITGHALAGAAAHAAAHGAASAIDPIFAALDEYQRGSTSIGYVCAKRSKQSKKLSGMAARAQRFMVTLMMPAMDAAAKRVFATTPRTISGVVALLRFMLNDPTEAFSFAFSDREWPGGLIENAAEGLDNILAADLGRSPNESPLIGP